MTTLVTALYDINREEVDGRKFEQYIVWLDGTLKLKTNFVIFTEDKVAHFLPRKKNIKIILSEPEEIPLFYLKDRIQAVINSNFFKQNMADLSRIECKTPLYNIIQYSKFEWLKYAINKNYFNSEYFFWIDAGCSRFFNELDTTKLFPNIDKVEKNKFLIQGNINTSKISIDENYIWKSDCVLVGTFFGGNKNIVKEISEKTLTFLKSTMLGQNIINNEQIALAYVAAQNPEMFNIYIELNGQHLPILKYLQ